MRDAVSDTVGALRISVFIRARNAGPTENRQPPACEAEAAQSAVAIKITFVFIFKILSVAYSASSARKNTPLATPSGTSTETVTLQPVSVSTVSPVRYSSSVHVASVARLVA